MELNRSSTTLAPKETKPQYTACIDFPLASSLVDFTRTATAPKTMTKTRYRTQPKKYYYLLLSPASSLTLNFNALIGPLQGAE